MKKTWIAAVVACGVPLAAQAVSDTYNPVTDARLLKPEAKNWLQYRGDYAGLGYSPLKQINDGNVSKLTLAWSFNTGLLEGHQSPPIVNDGYMYVTTPGSEVIALDAKTGEQLWRYKKELPPEMMQLHPTNRGVALYGDKVYVATLDCQVAALDAKTGAVKWITPIDDYKKGYYATLAPLAVKGKILVGCSGGELGVRGSVTAVDANDGKQLWKTYTVPEPKEPGGDSWPGETYKTGGGSIWVTGTYDAETNTTFWGTGNPAPWVSDKRKGDNLYTNSTIALDVETGKIKSHHQYTPHDSWDWDEVSAPLLIDTTIDGKKVKTAVHAARNGYLWVLDREKGKLKYRNAYSFANNNVFKSIDPKTGRPEVDETKRPGIGKEANFCPSLWGGKDWVPEGYSPDTELLYIPANVNMCAYLPAGKSPRYEAGGVYLGYPLDSILTAIRNPGPSVPDHIGELQAWDIKTGKKVWKHDYKSFMWGPILTTGGNLLFTGGSSDRQFRAFNAKTGEVLWQFPAPSPVIGVPTSFEVDGEQYVAVEAGWGVDAQRIQGALDSINKTNTVVPQGGTVLVFKLQK